GVFINPPTGASTSGARIVENVFSNMGVSAIHTAMRSVTVLKNVISDSPTGILLQAPGVPGGSVLVQDNVLEAKIGSQGIGISVFSTPSIPLQSLILDNVVSGFSRGMQILSCPGARIAGNVVPRGVAVGTNNGDGIVLLASTTQALLEDNQIQGNAGC